MMRMLSKIFIEKLYDIATNYKTLYVMGCFGAPLNEKNKTLFIEKYHWGYNNKQSRIKMIKNATSDTFGFDCVNLIKGVLWGWCGDTSKTYGGAKYLTNNVPDHGADQFIKDCDNVSSDFTNIIPGEMLWCSGHAGVYIGNGLAIECTPAWKNCVQITAVSNINKLAGYNNRKWTKHGRIPWVDYSDTKETNNNIENKSDENNDNTNIKIDYAKSFDKKIAGKYKVTASSLNFRCGAGINKTKLGEIKRESIVTCYGYYTSCSGVKWLLVVYKGKVGFVSSAYLNKQ